MHYFIAFTYAMQLCLSAQAWENHAILSSVAVADMPEVRDTKPVKVESLEDFVAAEKFSLTRVLDEEERWARAQVPNYPERPQTLRFDYHDTNTSTVQSRFLKAIRVNPGSKFALFLQELPGRPAKGVQHISSADVTLLPASLPPSSSFVVLKKGQMVSVADVFATAADEPDYGLDINLWEDSPSQFGRLYKFGDQPFGNPKLPYATQAPFHMGFYHEACILDLVASEITHTLPEYRIHLFYSLARVAFQTGHDYWGWRFAGLGAHYIQDLTQPYHAKVLPGASTIRLLYAGALDTIGLEGTKKELVEQASDEHLALENHVYCSVFGSLKHSKADPVASALRQTKADPFYYTPLYVREDLSCQAYDFADEAADALRPMLQSIKPDCSVPQKLSDPIFPKLMRNFGQHTRGYIRAVLANRKLQK